MTTPDIAGQCERLRAVESSGHGGVTTNWHRNPDGPQAADTLERQAAEIARLRGALASAAETLDHVDDALMAMAEAGAVPSVGTWRFVTQSAKRARAALTGEDA
jgi:hypothetical protein